MLDGIRAAKNFTPSGISASAPVGLWGYSGGALASAWAAQTQPRYAPELNLAGVAMGGIPADLKATLQAFSGSAFGGALIVAFVGVDRSYPKANFRQYINEAGRQAMANSQTDCLADGVRKYPFASIEQYGARPDIADDPGFSELLRNISPFGYPGTPDAPVLFYHSVLDQLAPIEGMRKLTAEYCADGVPVRKVESVAGEHGSHLVLGAPTAITYLTDRFADKPAPDDCDDG